MWSLCSDADQTQYFFNFRFATKEDSCPESVESSQSRIGAGFSLETRRTDPAALQEADHQMGDVGRIGGSPQGLVDVERRRQLSPIGSDDQDRAPKYDGGNGFGKYPASPVGAVRVDRDQRGADPELTLQGITPIFSALNVEVEENTVALLHEALLQKANVSRGIIIGTAGVAQEDLHLTSLTTSQGTQCRALHSMPSEARGCCYHAAAVGDCRSARPGTSTGYQKCAAAAPRRHKEQLAHAHRQHRESAMLMFRGSGSACLECSASSLCQRAHHGSRRNWPWPDSSCFGQLGSDATWTAACCFE